MIRLRNCTMRRTPPRPHRWGLSIRFVSQSMTIVVDEMLRYLWLLSLCGETHLPSDKGYINGPALSKWSNLGNDKKKLLYILWLKQVAVMQPSGFEKVQYKLSGRQAAWHLWYRFPGSRYLWSMQPWKRVSVGSTSWRECLHKKVRGMQAYFFRRNGRTNGLPLL